MFLIICSVCYYCSCHSHLLCASLFFNISIFICHITSQTSLIVCFFFFLFFLFMCEFVLLPTCNLFLFNTNVNCLPGFTSPYAYSRQPILLLHLIFIFVVIFSYKCKNTLKVVVVVELQRPAQFTFKATVRLAYFQGYYRGRLSPLLRCQYVWALLEVMIRFSQRLYVDMLITI